MGTDNFKRLIRNLRIDKELNDLCIKKGITRSLAKHIAFRIFLGRSDKEISQELQIHLSTTKKYRKILGSLEESKFNQIVKLPDLMTMRDS